MTHCHWEIYHAQWLIILNDEFLEAYEHGVVVEVCDNKQYRFTHVYLPILQITRKSKTSLCCLNIDNLIHLRIMIAGIWNLGQCPCPQCLIPMVHVPNMGMSWDLAQCVSLARVDDVDRCSHVQASWMVLRSISWFMVYFYLEHGDLFHFMILVSLIYDLTSLGSIFV